MGETTPKAPTPLRWYEQPAFTRLLLKLLGGVLLVAATAIENPLVDRVLVVVGQELMRDAPTPFQVSPPAPSTASLMTVDGG